MSLHLQGSRPVGAVGRSWWQRAGRAAVICLALTIVFPAHAAETIPARPTRYFNDYTLTVKPETADRLNQEMEDFEKESSNQLVAVIYQKLQSDSSVDDYCQRVARSWAFGQKDKNNAAVLFVFLDDRKVWIATGYGLEGALPDAIAKRIVSDEITPRFKAKDFDGGMAAGVESMIKAAKGEYKGIGTTQYQREHQEKEGGGLGLGTMIFLLIAAYFLFSMFRRRGNGGGGTMFTGGGPVFLPMGLGGFGGGGGSGPGDSGGSSSDGGGFISGGGGDFGGGGAGGDW